MAHCPSNVLDPTFDDDEVFVSEPPAASAAPGLNAAAFFFENAFTVGDCGAAGTAGTFGAPFVSVATVPAVVPTAPTMAAIAGQLN
jgi:hypothetical protein